MSFGEVIIDGAIVLLLVLVTLFTTIQTFYLEGMRLRTRDLPSLQFFKSEFEGRLNLRSEEGALSFSLWKHTCLVVYGILLLARAVDGEPLTGSALAESLIFAWAGTILCAYLIPQLLFRRTEGKWLNGLHGFFALSALMARPLVAVLGFLHSLLDIVKQDTADTEPATPAENIETLITAGTEEGLIEEEDRKLIQSVMAFGDKVVREVMTPRPNIVAIQADETLAALHELVVNEQYSRIPVFQGSIDEIIGFVHVRDMFEVAESSRAERKVRELMRPVRLVPETKPVNDLMREMQQEGGHMVIVVDEYGNTAGLATMEDLVEVILGEIRDEHEPDSDITEDGRGGYIVSGNFDLARVSDMLEFHPEEEIESTTVGGLVMEWLGRVPKAGESIERDGIRIEVLASDDLRVEQVRLSPSLSHAHTE
ncbi:MAG: HlyC/CorC family transporter [Acidobacteriota bacterium]|nr:HlyC/CorC family transporter [Acidobacteriota bacterium]